ncbi:MAG TPA: RHS repeat-associated core domain-containing protein [Bryobacteraceae bacterium]|nr:RHS repeat-associated core domain-containing protein [Bryobacteraceae bacterium]
MLISQQISDLRFTGKERDTETGLDYFGARFYGSALGRFTSPDPVFFQKAMLADPQRWNLYAYVRNNPLALVDPKGKLSNC